MSSFIKEIESDNVKNTENDKHKKKHKKKDKVNNNKHIYFSENDESEINEVNNEILTKKKRKSYEINETPKKKKIRSDGGNSSKDDQNCAISINLNDSENNGESFIDNIDKVNTSFVKQGNVLNLHISFVLKPEDNVAQTKNKILEECIINNKHLNKLTTEDAKDDNGDKQVKKVKKKKKIREEDPCTSQNDESNNVNKLEDLDYHKTKKKKKKDKRKEVEVSDIKELIKDEVIVIDDEIYKEKKVKAKKKSKNDEKKNPVEEEKEVKKKKKKSEKNKRTPENNTKKAKKSKKDKSEGVKQNKPDKLVETLLNEEKKSLFSKMKKKKKKSKMTKENDSMTRLNNSTPPTSPDKRTRLIEEIFQNQPEDSSITVVDEITESDIFDIDDNYANIKSFDEIGLNTQIELETVTTLSTDDIFNTQPTQLKLEVKEEQKQMNDLPQKDSITLKQESNPPQTESITPQQGSITLKQESNPPQKESISPQTESIPPQNRSIALQNKSILPQNESIPSQNESISVSFPTQATVNNMKLEACQIEKTVIEKPNNIVQSNQTASINLVHLSKLIKYFEDTDISKTIPVTSVDDTSILNHSNVLNQIEPSTSNNVNVESEGNSKPIGNVTEFESLCKLDETESEYECEEINKILSTSNLRRDEKQVLEKLEIHIPFELPLSHLIETSIFKEPNKYQKEQFATLGLEMNFDNFTQEEDDRILYNFRNLCKSLRISFNTTRPFVVKKYFKVVSKTERINFARCIGKSLDNRMLHSIYKRFVELFTGYVLRFSEKENEMLINYMEHIRDKRQGIMHISSLLSRDPIEVENHYAKLKEDKEYFNNKLHNRAYIDKFMDNLVKFTNSRNIYDLRRKDIAIKVWVRMSEALNQSIRPMKIFWEETLYVKIFLNKAESSLTFQEQLIDFLIQNTIYSWSAVNWTYMERVFQGSSSRKIKQLILDLFSYYVPSSLQKNFKASLFYMRKNVYTEKTLAEILFRSL